MTLEQALELVNLLNNVAPTILHLISAIKAAPADKPIGEIIAAADAQFDLNILNAQIEIARKG